MQLTYSHGPFLLRIVDHGIMQPILMHDPVSFRSFWWTTLVEHKCLFHSIALHPTGSENWFVSSSSLPITRSSCSIRPQSIRILPVPRSKEIPFILPKQSLTCSQWEVIYIIPLVNNNHNNKSLISLGEYLKKTVNETKTKSVQLLSQTWELPWIILVKIYFCYERSRKGWWCNFVSEIVNN